MLEWILQTYPTLRYVSISGKRTKKSAVNGTLGRGKNVVAEVTIPNEFMQALFENDARQGVD